MDTSISLPKDALARSNKRAAELHLSQTEFFAIAIDRYLAYLDSLSLTRDMAAILAGIEAA
jgi:hypothetical protein